MKCSHKNDEAVSPVIGVILMVAITVILAAVIASFVFGMAGTMEKSKTVAFTVHRTTATNVSITNMGGQDVGSLTGVNVTIDDNDPVAWTAGNAVGATKQYAVASSQSHIIVTGTFTDGSDQVILDTYV